MAGNAVSVERLLPWIGGKSRLAGRFEDLVEPYLMQLGFLKRTTRGRMATEAAYLHIGLSYPRKENDSQQKLL